MKRMASLLLITLFVMACSSAATAGAVTPGYIETGVDPDAWALIPAGAFPYGQHDHSTIIEYDYEMMITDVTVEQYSAFLNAAIAAGAAAVGSFEVEAGEVIRIVEGAGGYYGGDPFDEYKHEEAIKAGDHLYVPFVDGLRLTYDGQSFAPLPAYRNHPMTQVTWFGANAYCQFAGARLPAEMEWEKAARGPAMVDDHGLPFPWGLEIHGNNANYYSSADLFEKISGKLGNTTPVGFYNGRSYDGYETRDSASPYGLYDMAGNVWQWMGDDYSDQHYRHLRGGSYYSYEVDLRVWKFNSAGPQHYSAEVGFRCAQEPGQGS